MNICRFRLHETDDRIGLVVDDTQVLDLTAAGITELEPLLERADILERLRAVTDANLPRHPLAAITLLAPVEQQEVWAAGVTYLRSKTARMEESDFSATAYDRVYAAARPEIFFKALPGKVVPTNDAVGIRRDAKWNVPEPELVVLFNSHGRLAGCTIGNDMSSRDIEGENLLYLPQAKIYERSCAMGPWITVGVPEEAARGWKITLSIRRDGQAIFAGETSVAQIKRRFAELGEYLFRSQRFPHGVALFTGTGIVPPDTFTLREGDGIDIEISGIGQLRNHVIVV